VAISGPALARTVSGNLGLASAHRDETTWIEKHRQMWKPVWTDSTHSSGARKHPQMSKHGKTTTVRTDLTTPIPCEIRIERIFDANRERVRRAFTDPKPS
jgi:hypothetical protein